MQVGTADHTATIDRLNKDLGLEPKSASGGALDNANVNFDTFLKLLTTQLKHQDPLEPMDGTKFTEQIATFSSLEQQIATNKHLEKLTEARDFSAQSLAVSYIGKEALVEGKKMTTLADGAGGSFAYELDEPVSSVVIEITSPQGEVVRTLEGKTNVGLTEVKWDGLTDDEDPAPAGNYNVFISALAPDGTELKPDTFTYGRVDSVEADGSTVILATADGRKSNFNDVLVVREARQVDEE